MVEGAIQPPAFDMCAHFALLQATYVPELRVRWPIIFPGVVNGLLDDRRRHEIHGPKVLHCYNGSCPGPRTEWVSRKTSKQWQIPTLHSLAYPHYKL
jgi:hypothetical protein